MQNLEKISDYDIEVTNLLSPSIGMFLPVGDITLQEDLSESFVEPMYSDGLGLSGILLFEKISTSHFLSRSIGMVLPVGDITLREDLYESFLEPKYSDGLACRGYYSSRRSLRVIC